MFKIFSDSTQIQGKNCQLYEVKPLDQTGTQFCGEMKMMERTMTSLKKGGRKTSRFKKMPGRGRKVEAWKKWL